MRKYTDLSCQSCGEIIEGVEDYDADDVTTMYCQACFDDNYELKPYEVILELVTCRIKERQKISYKDARNIARERMIDLPAWKELGV